VTTSPGLLDGIAEPVNALDPLPAQIGLAGIRHEYHSTSGDVLALDGIDLDIEAGEFVCIVGPSGCGKSTLLELVAGLRAPTDGQLTIAGRTIIGPSRRRGVVFQQSSSLYPWLTVRGNVELGLRLARVPRRERHARADQELARVNLTEFASHHPYELSGGMQQRCQIARALANDPEVLLLDEPFGALDAMTRETLQSELRTIWQSTGRTVVFVTHSVEEAMLLATRIVVISPRPGRITHDINVSYSRSGLSPRELRADAGFVDACHHLRIALHEGEPS
jgi:ABC-type nitrate/sulfonate/bicarbonate transport system ATPase subunit